MGDVAPLRQAPSLADAAAAFLSDRDLSAGSRRVHGGTLRSLVDALGPQRPVNEVDDQEAAAALTAVAAGNAPATWNRKVATVRSFVAWCRRHGWSAMDGAALERRRAPTDDTRAIPRRDLEELWGRADLGLREVTLCRLLYETAARTQEVLTLDVDDLDVRGRRAVVTGKGGGQEVIHWQTASARLLARLLRGRTAGPVFLTHRRAGRGREPALVDLDPVSGRARPLLPSRRRTVHRRDGLDPPPATPLRPDAPRRGQHLPGAPRRQKPTRLLADPSTLRPSRAGCGGADDGRA